MAFPPTDSSSRATGAVRAIALALAAAGLGVRLIGIFGGGRLFWHWPTEDGYLMLTALIFFCRRLVTHIR